jgi:hypothetical protein
MAIWPLQSLQIAWFLTSVEGIRAQAVFEAIFGEEPQNIQTNKLPNPANPFFGVASGAVDGIQGQVQVQPGRVDLVLTPPNDDPTQDLPLFDAHTTISKIVEQIKKPSFPPAFRCAMVANLAHPAPDLQAAADIFVQTTGITLPMSDVSDLILQLNRRKHLSSTIELNRLMRYSIANFQSFVIEMIPNIGMPGQTVPISKQTFATMLALDFNTVPNGKTFEGEEINTIFDQAATELLRVATIGTPSGLADINE